MNQTPDDARKMNALYDEAAEIAKGIRQIEGGFFQQVTAVLSEKQLPLLEIARMRRERKLAHSMWPPMNGYQFDLDDVLHEMDNEGVDLTPREPEVFDSLVQAWRTTITSAYVRNARHWNEGDNERRLLNAEMITAMREGQRDRAIELGAKETEFKEPLANAATRIVEQHRQYVEQIAAQLGKRSRERLLQVFNERMYKPLYPDPADLTKFLEAVDDLSLSETQRVAITDIRGAWEAEAAPALTNYLGIHLAWREEMFAHGYGNHNYPEYTRKMSNAIDSRIKRCNALIDSMLEVLSDKQDQKVADEIKAWREGVTRFREEQESYREKYSGWPAPTLVR